MKDKGYPITDISDITGLTLEEIEKAVEEGRADELIAPCDEMLGTYPAVRVTTKQAFYFSNGGALDLERVKDKETVGICRVKSPEGKLVGLTVKQVFLRSKKYSFTEADFSTK